MASNKIMDSVSGSLGGKKEKTPKKEVKEIRTRKGASGGFIHTHSHTRPEHHPDEEHVSPDQDAMVEHMLSNLGTPNPGEQEAEAGAGASPQPSPTAGNPPPAAVPGA